MIGATEQGTLNGEPPATASRRATLRAAGSRALAFAIAWWALIEGDPRGLLFGVPVVLGATVASLKLSPPSLPQPRLRLVGLARLAIAFLVGSLRSGWQIALLACRARPPLSPILVRYRTCLRPGAETHVLTSIITLMPGTLCIDTQGDEIAIHSLLDQKDVVTSEFAHIEARIIGAMRAVGESEGG